MQTAMVGLWPAKNAAAGPNWPGGGAGGGRVDAAAPRHDPVPMNTAPVARTALPALIAIAALAGCAGPDRAAAIDPDAIRPRTDLAMFDGRSGAAMTWPQLMDGIADADVVIIGELHDDAVGHRVQRALVEDAVARFDNIALSMEMLERGEQWIVDDYLADLIDRERFIQDTASTRWRQLARQYLDGEIRRREFSEKIMAPGWPDWESNYQPIIDAAKAGGAKVIAANAPFARYSKFIPADNYDGLEKMTPAQRRLVETADVPPSGRYRERFWEVMAGRAEGAEPAPAPEAADGEDPHPPQTDEQVRRGLYVQMLYDATMADSIADALNDGAAKVIHLVGQFHSDFEGGTVLELRRRAPEARIVVISMQREPASGLRDEDRDRGDVVMYTMPR